MTHILLFQMKTIKDCHKLFLKCDILLLAGAFQKFRKNSLKIMDHVRVII